jgi:PRC-barrel domain
MSLHKIKDFDPDYRQHFDDVDMIGYDLYSGDEKIGTVENILVDDRGSFRYFVINTGVWILGKRTLLPIGRSRIEAGDRRVYADGLSREQIESLPEYDENSNVDDWNARYGNARHDWGTGYNAPQHDGDGRYGNAYNWHARRSDYADAGQVYPSR